LLANCRDRRITGEIGPLIWPRYRRTQADLRVLIAGGLPPRFGVNTLRWLFPSGPQSGTWQRIGKRYGRLIAGDRSEARQLSFSQVCHAALQNILNFE
jgi:hypothetical protein